MGFFQVGHGPVEPVALPCLEISLPGHGVAAALVGVDGSVNPRLVPIVDGGRAGQEELEQHRTPEVRKGNLGVIVKSRGIVAVEQVKLGFPEGKGQLPEMLHDPVLQILGRHMVADRLQNRIPGHEQVRLPIEGADNPATAIVIHGRVPFAALQILGAVPPVLREDIGLVILLPDALTNLRPELVGQLNLSVPGEDIRHVEAPAVNGIWGLEPFFQDGVLSPIDDVPEGIGGIVQGGHGF